MRSLSSVTLTAEQIKLLVDPQPGIRIIMGAAGSGKTTLAIGMLHMALGYLLGDKKRTGRTEPIRAVVFTFNRTLSAYIKNLTEETIAKVKAKPSDINLEITTLANYAYRNFRESSEAILDKASQNVMIKNLSANIDLDPEFLINEVEYLLGRFLPENLTNYLDFERTGRGTSPRVDRKLREVLLETVIKPYTRLKNEQSKLDWNDLFLRMAHYKFQPIDIIIVDESQDFSANELRAILNQSASVGYTTFVLDTAQRIYARGFTWKEIGLDIRPEQTHRLQKNYRNTLEIATFASQLIDAKKLDENGTLPLFSSSEMGGRLPIIFEGTFTDQVNEALDFIREHVDLSNETVAFLHAKGGGWFKSLKQALNAVNLEYIEITRTNEWPDGDQQIALSTINSVKGLEFDHIFLLGLSNECFNYDDSDGDNDEYLRVCRLVSMAITRARKSVMLGYKESSKPSFLSLFESNTYEFKRAK